MTLAAVSQHRVWVYGDHVNTDVIFPGKYTYTLKTPEEIASKALEDLDPDFARHVRADDVIIAGCNWGCGSSREQAVLALKYHGIQFIIAASFNGLYFRNCINQGIHPIICPELHGMVKTGDKISIELSSDRLFAQDTVFTIPALSPGVRAILDAGGLVPMLEGRFNADTYPA
jgi:3-isopropylmalate/(R)-2-methylmalate dehydratase small subunit